MKENDLPFVMDNPSPSTSQNNTECPVVVDTSGVFKRNIRFKYLTILNQVRNPISLLKKLCY